MKNKIAIICMAMSVGVMVGCSTNQAGTSLKNETENNV